MDRILCHTCKFIFKGHQHEQTFDPPTSVGHHDSLEQFFDAVGMGCFICCQLNRRLFAKPVQPLNLKSLKSTFVFDNFNIPGTLRILINWEGNDGDSQMDKVFFRISPLRPGSHLGPLF